MRTTCSVAFALTLCLLPLGIGEAQVSVSAEIELDPPVLQTGTLGDFVWPAAAWNGTVHLVVWSAPGGPGQGSDLFGARVDGSGTLLDASPTHVAGGGTSPQRVAVASDGSAFLVAYVEDGGARGVRVDGSGVVLDPTPVAIAPAAWPELGVTFGGGVYLVASRDSAGVRATRLTPAGAVLDAAGIALEANAFRPAVAWNGATFLVVYDRAGKRRSAANRAGR